MLACKQTYINIFKINRNQRMVSGIVINGRSIEVSAKIARSLGYLTIPAGMEIDIGQVTDYPDDDIIIITTGSQGEPMSALARMASGTHKQIKIKAGALSYVVFLSFVLFSLASLFIVLRSLKVRHIRKEISYFIFYSSYCWRQTITQQIKLFHPTRMSPGDTLYSI